MTANELANELDECNLVYRDSTTNLYFDKVELSNKVSTMLRQQEQKIASLEKDLFMLQKHYDQLCEDCTCQGGHSEAYLKAKGKL
jgi:hypothetical protein